MIVSRKHKFIFIKNRKISGSTFESLVFPHLGSDDVCTGSPTDGTPSLNDTTGHGHMPCQLIAELYPEEWGSYSKIAIERNPWDKCASAFKWHSIIKPNLAGVSTQDFSLYLKTCSHMLPTDWNNYSVDGVPQADVYKYEEIDRLYGNMRDEFGIDIPDDVRYNTRLKSTKGKHYTEYYTPEDVDFVSNLFKNEIREYGYEYGKG